MDSTSITTVTSPIEAAWASFVSAHDRQPGSEHDAAFNAQVDAADHVLLHESATTLTAVAAKLRRLLILFVGTALADRLAFGKADADDLQQVDSDGDARMMWGLIEDVERMAAQVRASAVGNPAFDTALAEYRRRKVVEDSFGDFETLEEERRQEQAFNAASTKTDAAFAEMITIPVGDGPRVWTKLAAIIDHYPVGGICLKADVQAQVFAEARIALTGEAQS